MSVDALQFGVIVTGAVLIISVIYELAAMWLRRHDDDHYDGRTKH